MTMMTLNQSEQPVSNGVRVGVSRSERVGPVSSKWFSRPDDVGEGSGELLAQTAASPNRRW
jgi:hypothetical protein